jgi:hypothetical protein
MNSRVAARRTPQTLAAQRKTCTRRAPTVGAHSSKGVALDDIEREVLAGDRDRRGNAAATPDRRPFATGGQQPPYLALAPAEDRDDPVRAIPAGAHRHSLGPRPRAHAGGGERVTIVSRDDHVRDELLQVDRRAT